MILANLHITLRNSRLRHTRRCTVAVLLPFIALSLYGVLEWIPKIPGYNVLHGDGLYLISAAVFFIPLYFLTDQPALKTITIMSIAWIYTMGAYVISHRLAFYFNSESLQINSLVIQTLIYVLTYRAYYRMSVDKFNQVIWNIEKSSLRILAEMSILILSLLFLLNYGYVNGYSVISELAEPTIIISIGVLSMNLAKSYVLADKSLKSIMKKMSRDSLTRLGNREAMIEDAMMRIKKGAPFCLMFADLDQFKAVNDTYGHQVGDDYLVAFSNTVRKFLGPDDKFYRIAGDEFVLLCDVKGHNELIENLESMDFINDPKDVKFRGLSTGHVIYPNEAVGIVEMLSKADERMYQEKKKKHYQQHIEK